VSAQPRHDHPGSRADATDATRQPLGTAGTGSAPLAETRNAWIRSVVAVLAIGAGGVQAAAAGTVGVESGLYMAFFLGVATAQVLWGAILIARSPGWLVVAGAAGNLVILGTWVLSRTAGVPVGPSAGVALPVGFPDAVSAMFEAAIVIGSLALVLGHANPQTSLGRAPVAATLAAVVIVIAVAVAAVLAQLGAIGFLPAGA